MRASPSRIWALARKEFYHIARDYRTLAIVVLMPIVQLVMFGYALNLEIQRVDLGVVDHARNRWSRDLIARFEGSKLFHLRPGPDLPEQVDHLFRARRVQAVLVIPARFGEDLEQRGSSPVQLLVDSSDPNAATLIRDYVRRITLSFSTQGYTAPQPIDFRPTILFNPDMKSAYFFVPGIIALVLVMISALLTSITITREKETGTIEMLLASPVRPHEIVLGKVLPYVGLAFVDAVFILSVGVLLFGVPFRGDPLLLLLLTVVYVTTGLSLGLILSTLARTQQVAMIMAMVITLLPTLMLSGLIFPIASMPRWLQLLTYIVPARYYLLIVRGILLKGSAFAQLVQPSLVLAGTSMFLLALSARRLKMTLEV
ncbi:MAG: ABC transporter permease [candidate division KSB1 bacterium]|nr:ABC transporter permease [candidate division KSB1 bacterium]